MRATKKKSYILMCCNYYNFGYRNVRYQLPCETFKKLIKFEKKINLISIIA